MLRRRTTKINNIFSNFGVFKLLFSYIIISEGFCAKNKDPEFIEPVPNVTATIGKYVSLPCRVKNLGSHKVSWIHIDKKRRVLLSVHTHVLSQAHRYNVAYDNEGSWFLHVKEVRQEDSGYYMCQINTRPIKSQVGYLKVIEPPHFVDDESTTNFTSVNITENGNLTLKCKADGFPFPTIIWKREDGQDIQLGKTNKGTEVIGEELQFHKITRTDSAVYSCVASNTAHPSISRRISVNVQFRPIVVVSNQLIGATLKSNVTLTCQVEANPTATTYWIFKETDKLRTTAPGKYSTSSVANSYRTNAKLTIRTVNRKDFGKYRCKSKNSLGETEGAITLYELLPSNATHRIPSSQSKVKSNHSTGIQNMELQKHTTGKQQLQIYDNTANNHMNLSTKPTYIINSANYRANWVKCHLMLVFILIIQ